MKGFVLFMCFLFLCSCSLEQIGQGPRSDADGVWRGPSYGKHMSGTVYAVAIDYPDGYDWRADPGSGQVEGICIVMFADGAPVLKVPVGDLYEISSDPQKLRIRSGHLYTDYTDGRQTIIKRDGEEILRYDGAEEVVSLEVMDGKVHMLCIPSSGEGFVYRIDGNVSVERNVGILSGPLKIHDGSAGFCFSSKSGNYMVEDGKVFLMEVDKDIADVLDMCLSEGQPCMLVRTEGTSALTMIRKGTRLHYDPHESRDIVSARFLDTDSLCVRLRCRDGISDNMSDVLWFGDGLSRRPRRSCQLLSVVVDASGYHAVANPSEIHMGTIISNRETYYIPSDYYAYGDGCAVSRDSILYVGLTSGKGQGPVIWMDGTLDTLDVNGPLVCLR